MYIFVVLSLFGLVGIYRSEEVECPPTYVDCYCENYFEHFIQIPVNTTIQENEETGLTSCIADIYPPNVCMERGCDLIPNENFKSLFGKGKKAFHLKDLRDGKALLSKKNSKWFWANPAAEENIYLSKQKRSAGRLLTTMMLSLYPQEIVIKPEDYYGKRKKRSRKECGIPQLENSEVTCWKWPNWITCNQECIFGHGLENGKKTSQKTSMNCRYTENKWKPHNIQDCKPFINCKAHLKSPGDLNCVQMTKKPSYCEIRCEEYDDVPATDLVKYTCDGKFDLPHCAILDDTVSLIEPPTD